MPTTTNSTVIFIGNFADLDTDEADWDNENPNVVLGNHDTLSFVDITNVDNNDDGIMMDNDAGAGSTDFLSYDTGSGTTNSALDSTSVYNADVLLGDGSVMNIQVIVIQVANGDTFIVDHPSFQLDNLQIQSIELTSEDSSQYSGYSADPSIDNSEIVCFASGTSILTPNGPVPVENITPGMMVCTMDRGDQPVRWVNANHAQRADKNACITFAKGCLGQGLPTRNLRVSPQHRVLLTSKIVARMFDTPEVLARAKHLMNLPGVTQSLGFLPITYHHIACDQHEIIFAEGAAVETFYAGAQARAALSDEAIVQLIKGVPNLGDPHPPRPARPFAGHAKVQKLLARHLKNHRKLVGA